MLKVNMWNEGRSNPLNCPLEAQCSEIEEDKYYLLDDVKAIMAELSALVGLKEVKKLVAEMFAYVQIQKKRQTAQLATEPMVLHMIFKGNPGTGKTTVARIIGKLLHELGVLEKGHLVEVERGDIVGEYIGQTAQKTREQIKKAIGGILFIDEAYSLARGGNRDFGKEAIDALVKSMEDRREEFILILAGYNEEMDRFLLTNPGLRSRFPIKISFPNYSTNELLAIANIMLKKRQYFLSNKAREELRFILERESREFRNSGNARLVRNIIEGAIRRQAVRLIRQKEFSRDNLIMIAREDLLYYN